MSEAKVFIYPKFPVKKQVKDKFVTLIFKLFEATVTDSVSVVEFNYLKLNDQKTEAIDQVIIVFEDNRSKINSIQSNTRIDNFYFI